VRAGAGGLLASTGHAGHSRDTRGRALATRMGRMSRTTTYIVAALYTVACVLALAGIAQV
jgi:hypothetical protein